MQCAVAVRSMLVEAEMCPTRPLECWLQRQLAGCSAAARLEAPQGLRHHSAVPPTALQPGMALLRPTDHSWVL